MDSHPECTDHSSSGETHHSQPPSLGRPKKAKGQQQQRAERSLTTTIVGPAKTRITKLTRKAEKLLKKGPAIQFTLKLVNPGMVGQQEHLQAADAVLLDMKRVVHKLTSLYHYVEVNFDTPSMNASTLKERYLEEVYTLIAKAKPHGLATKLQEFIFALEVQLKELGAQFTNYTPSDHYESETLDAIADRVKHTLDANGSANSLLVAPEVPGALANDPEQTRKLMEMEEQVKRLQLQLENEEKEALLKEQENLRNSSELERRHLTQHASLQRKLLETMTRESMATKRATQLQAEVDKSKNRPTRREEIPMPQQIQANTPFPVHPLFQLDPSASTLNSEQIRAGNPSILNSEQIRAGNPSTLNSEQIRAGNPNTLNSEQIRAGNPSTLNSEQIRAGNPSTLNHDQIRAGRPTTEAPSEHLQNRATAPIFYNNAVLEMLQKIHEETMRSNTDMRANIAEILNNQREREHADSYADQYENAFSGAEDPRSGERQNNSGPFSTQGNSHNDYSNTHPQHIYQIHPYDRKFDPTKHLSTFDGTGDLEHFQYEFDAHVTKDPRFSANERFLILRKVLAGQALQHLNLSMNPQEAIDKTFALLHKTYGNNQTQSSLLAKLTELPFHPYDPQQMRQNLATIITVLEQLYQRGIPDNDFRTINDIVRKLPSSIRRDVCELMVEVKEGLTHSQVLEQIYSKIAGLEMDETLLSHGHERKLKEITESFGEINLVNASGTSKTGRKSTVYPNTPQAKKKEYTKDGPQNDFCGKPENHPTGGNDRKQFFRTQAETTPQ